MFAHKRYFIGELGDYRRDCRLRWLADFTERSRGVPTDDGVRMSQQLRQLGHRFGSVPFVIRDDANRFGFRELGEQCGNDATEFWR